MIEAPDSALVADLHPSPNIEDRKGGLTPSILLLHYTGMPSVDRAIDVLSRPDCKVSCHYVVDVDGRIVQMVAEDKRAWHAGVSSWKGETDINSASIGIEIQNPGHADGYPDFPPAQMRAVTALSQDILSRHDIPPPGVLAHSDVAPGRKIDPGEKFDWPGLAAEGVGFWVPPAAVDEADTGLQPGAEGEAVAHAQKLLAAYGYGIATDGVFDEKTEKVVQSFQLHFRPGRVDGHLDASTIATLESLLAALPRPATS